jgi:hypothetical protein
MSEGEILDKIDELGHHVDRKTAEVEEKLDEILAALQHIATVLEDK